jgi:alginate O-acetyltransferase complex protein AlgI
MELNSPVFLFIFLPAFLVCYSACPARVRNILLLVSSAAFLIWSDPLYFPGIFSLTLLTAAFLAGIQKNALDIRKVKRLKTAGVAIHLISLLCFKILAAYGTAILAAAAQTGIDLPSRISAYLPQIARLPLGLSFLVFQAVSLLLDAPYDTANNGRVFLPASLHLLLFPKVISGPLVRFDQFRRQIKEKQFSLEHVAAGLRRFMLGFAKKALIADQLALVANSGIFNQAPARIPAGSAWIAILCYALQIYFDFAAYCDMAIGLGLALGFKFPENFNHPYWSVSITDFWRRWHMTLSAWFRDYVFYPLERKRARSKKGSQSLNILIVFLLTGLWHGITPPFIVWGLIQGAALALESGRFGRWLRRLWQPLQHLYALLVILFGWVFFRSPSLAYALQFLKALGSVFNPVKPLPYSVFPPISTLTWIAFGAGILLSLPLNKITEICLPKVDRENRTWIWVRNGLALALFLIAIVVQAGANYQPFIYGEF